MMPLYIFSLHLNLNNVKQKQKTNLNFLNDEIIIHTFMALEMKLDSPGTKSI